jgi:hypothetical protein
MRSKTKSLSKKKADTYFAQFIRLRDKDKPCITCGQFKSDKDCGHFISRRFDSTRYDEKNANGQCLTCNRFQYGNQYAHGKAIDKLYGEGTADSLHLKSRMMSNRNQYDYEVIAETYREKIKGSGK